MEIINYFIFRKWKLSLWIVYRIAGQAPRACYMSPFQGLIYLGGRGTCHFEERSDEKSIEIPWLRPWVDPGVSAKRKLTPGSEGETGRKWRKGVVLSDSTVLGFSREESINMNLDSSVVSLLQNDEGMGFSPAILRGRNDI